MGCGWSIKVHSCLLTLDAGCWMRSARRADQWQMFRLSENVWLATKKPSANFYTLPIT